MIRPILQYRPLDRGFLVCLPEPADTADLAARAADPAGRTCTAGTGSRRPGPGSSCRIPVWWRPIRCPSAGSARCPGWPPCPRDPDRFGGEPGLLGRGPAPAAVAGDPRRPPAPAGHQEQSLARHLGHQPHQPFRPRGPARSWSRPCRPSAYAFPEDDMWVFTKGLALGTLDTEELEDDLAMPPRPRAAAAVLPGGRHRLPGAVRGRHPAARARIRAWASSIASGATSGTACPGTSASWWPSAIR